MKNIRSVPLRTEFPLPIKGRAPDLVLLRGGLASKIELQGGSLEYKIVYRGVDADFEKPKIFFRLTMTGKHETWRKAVSKKL